MVQTLGWDSIRTLLLRTQSHLLGVPPHGLTSYATNATMVERRYLTVGSTHLHKMQFDEYVKAKRSCIRIMIEESFFGCLLYHFSDAAYQKNMVKNASRDSHLFAEKAKQYGSGKPQLKDFPSIEEKWDLKLRVYRYPDMDLLYSSVRESDTASLCALLRSSDDRYVYLKWEQQGSLVGKHQKVCPSCDKVYRSDLHSCLQTCHDCCSPKCDAGRGDHQIKKTLYHPKKCALCNWNFLSEQCRQLHFETGICKTRRKCLDCKQTYTQVFGEEHRCYMHKCKSCKEMVTEEHVCFMQRLEESDLKVPSEKYIFFDIETCLRGEKELVFSCLVAVVYDSEDLVVFESMNNFVDWALDNYPGYTLISHYGGRFDMHYVKQWCLERGRTTSDIMTGMKYSEIKIGVNKKGGYLLRLIDSHRFIPIALRQFAKTFSLPTSKTFFPHKFYTEENRKYKGVMPDRSFFKEQGQSDFEEWYSEFEGKEVDLFHICVEYCKIDVKVLQQGCLKFRRLFMDLTQDEVDPFQYLTIASTVMTIYRRFHMPADTIPLQPILKDREKRAYWLRYRGQRQTGMVPPQIMDITGSHFKPHAVDRFSNHYVLYYMHSCIDVGCSKCYTPYQQHPTSGTHMTTLAHLWKETVKVLRELGCEVHEITACQVAKPTKEQLALLDEYLFIEPRDAFYGGRVEPIVLFREPAEDEVIRYADYTSLYPSTQFCEYRGVTPETYHKKREIAYPKGHPVLVPNPTVDELDQYFGFIHCRVTVPENEYMPILPTRDEGKLMFCTGVLTGTWTTMHVQKAVERGAIVNEIFHVLHYEESTTTMWKSYVSTFLRIKQQAAGWKALLGEVYEDEEARREYIRQYAEHQGIDLNPEEISNEKNTGMYYLSKLCLNSLWGKFGQRNNFDQILECFHMEEAQAILSDPTMQISSLEFDNNVIRLKYKCREEAQAHAKNTSVPIAAFTTSYAQLRLYEALEVLGQRVLYMDTDSVIYVEKKTEPPLLQMGPYLGDLTDELDGDTIQSFVTIAPKTYAYVTHRNKEVTRTKGFVSGAVSRQDLMKALEDHDYVKRVTPFQLVIARDHTITEKLYKEGEGKQFRFTFNKRKICEVDGNEYGTRPFKKHRQ